MKRKGLLALLLTVGMVWPAYADVTVHMTTGGSGMGMSRKTSGTTYIKGNKMRSDLQMGKQVQSTIFDLDEQKLYMFDSRKKEVEVWDMATFGAEVLDKVDTAGMKASVKPNQQTKQFGEHTAEGYDMEIVVPMSAPGATADQQMTVTLAGPVWVVKDVPGAEDYRAFYRTAAERGWIFGDPRAAKGQPGQAKAMAEMYRQFAEIGGIPFETNIQIKMGMGEVAGPLGGLLGRIGNITMTTTVDKVETGPLSDDLFAPPAGYKITTRK
jgi:hypothetical protein